MRPRGVRRGLAIQVFVSTAGRDFDRAPSRQNRLTLPFSLRVTHSIQRRIAPLTNHKEYGFKQSSA
jgi:hypothetical protein